MYIFKNAIVSIWRNKPRNILIGIIVFIIAFSSAISLAINNSATKIINSYDSKNEILGTISFNRKQMMQNFDPGSDNNESNIKKFNEIESLTLDELKTYADSNYVTDFFYTTSIGMDGKNIDVATETVQKTIFSGPRIPGGESNSRTKTTKNNRVRSGDFTLIGYENYESMSDFVTGKYKITLGTILSNFTENECLINSELATLNELAIGDVIKLKNPSDEDLVYKLTVVGIYEEQSSDNDTIKMFTTSVNQIITNMTVINSIIIDDEDITTTINASYTIKDKNSIELLANELTTKGLSDNYELTTNIDTIEAETASLSNLKTFAITFLIITLIIGSVILLVVNIINLRERKYEIGVLRTIGMKKSKVTMQYLTELIVVAFFALIAGSVAGAVVSVPTANYLLQEEINSAQEEKTNINDNFGGMDIGRELKSLKKIDAVTEIEAVVDIKVLGELMLIGLAITIISGTSAIFSIARFSPLTILKERS